MLIDLPPNPPQAPVVMVADASQARKPASAIRSVGVCEPMANLPDDPYFGTTRINFKAVTVNYLAKYEKVNFATQTAKVTLLQPPAHGAMTEIVKGAATYKPDRNFHSQDQIVALVELGGYQVRVVYFIKVQPEGTGGISNDDDEMIRQFCGSKGRTWKIALPSTLPTLDSSTLQALRNVTGITSSVVVVDMADLSGAATGQTTGTTITLDTNAAGYGWFVDATPGDNSEFLPTSNPNEWVAMKIAHSPSAIHFSTTDCVPYSANDRGWLRYGLGQGEA